MTLLKNPEEFDRSGLLITVGIPAFNEEQTIAKLVLQAQKFADIVLVCDDGSTDMTAEIAERMGAKVIKHDRNFGYGAAIKSLFTMARELQADILVTIDADGQHNPKEIPQMIEPILDNKADIVLGSRFLGNNENSIPRYRKWGIKIISKLTGVASDHKVNDAQCGFRAYGPQAIKGLKLVENGMGLSVELVMKAKKQGLTVIEVSTECKYRNLGRTSTQNPFSHASGILLSILRFAIEDRPLIALGIPGILCLLSGMGFGIWMFQLYVLEHRIITNIALASIAFILIGMFMLFTSITLYAISRQAQRNGN